MRKKIVSFINLIIVFSLVYCKKGKELDILLPLNVFNYENQIIIEHISKEIILKTYEQWVYSTKNLKEKSYNFKYNPDIENLKKWQSAFLKVYDLTTQVETFYFGPANDSRTLYLNIYSWSFNKEACITNLNCINSVVSILSGSEQINQNYIDQFLGVNLKGLSILEYLIFTDGGVVFSEKSELNSIFASLAGRKLDFAVALSESIYANSFLIYSEWKNQFINTFIYPGILNYKYKSQLDIFSEINVQIIDQLSRIIDRKLGYPAGFSVSSGGRFHLDKIESKYAKFSLNSIYNNLKTIQNLYEGMESDKGIKKILKRNNPELMEVFSNEIQEIVLYFEYNKNHNITLDELINNEHNKLKEYYERIRYLRIFFSSEFVSATGTNPGVGSSDGD